MKTRLLISLAFIAVFVFACKGPSGPEGPQGVMGPTGPQGIPGKDGAKGQDGVNGKDAGAKVKTTGWMKLDFAGGANAIKNFSSGGAVYTSIVELHLKDRKQPLLTKNILESGMTLIYVKGYMTYLDLAASESGYKYNLKPTIVLMSDNIYTKFKIKDKPDHEFSSYAEAVLMVDEIAENYWNPWIYFMTPFTTNSQTNLSTSTAPYMVAQPMDFYVNLFKNEIGLEIKLVTVEGTVGAKMQHIDFSNYEEVKEAFNLED